MTHLHDPILRLTRDSHLDGDKDNYRRHAADTALQRQLIAPKKKTVSKKALDGYSAGMDSGNSERYFYLGGT